MLGTPHLSQVKDFDPKMLENLIRDLTREAFQVVCIENMPAELLYDIRSRHDDAFGDVLTSFGGNRLSVADSVQMLLGLSFQEAESRFNQMAVGQDLSEKEHLMMIEYALASADPVSAALHYTYLQDKASIAESNLPKRYFDALIKDVNTANEVYSIALKLAVNQGLNKLEYIDNFQDEALLFKYFPDFIQEYTEHQELFKDLEGLPVFVKAHELQRKGIEEEDLSEYYRYMNSEEFMEQDFEAQWAIWLKTNFPSGSDKARYYLWEMRNLQIAANIMKVSSLYPGKKILVIIGASHKSFLEKYLSQVSGLEILRLE